MATYHTDINGYILLETSNISNYGALTSNDDNHTEIQNAIDADYRMVKIGNSKNDVFYVSQPLVFKDNKTYLINGTIKMIAGVTTTLTKDVTANDMTIEVTSTNGLAVGKWIIVKPTSGNGSSNKIAEINGNVITLTYPSLYNCLVTNGAYLVTADSVFLGENSSYVKILGSGCIDANKENQLAAYPVKYVGGEDTRTQCALTFYGSNYTTIEGTELEIKGGLLHGISFFAAAPSYNDHITVSGVYSHGAKYKNMLVARARYINVTDSEFNDSDLEDGLIFYVTCTDAYINNITAKRNPRGGVYWNSDYNDRLTGGNITTEGNGSGILIASKGVTLSNIDSIDRLYITGGYTCNNITISNLTIHDLTATQMILLRGDISDITLNNVIIEDCDGIGINTAAISAVYPDSVEFSDGGIYRHTGTKTNILGNSDITFNNFEGLT